MIEEKEKIVEKEPTTAKSPRNIQGKKAVRKSLL